VVVTLTGENDFLRKAELRKLVDGFVAEHGDMAVERYDGDEADAARMRESVGSLPFLTARKLVILDEPGKQKAFAEHIDAILKEVAETTDVVIIEPKLDKRSSYYKTLKKSTDFREFSDLDGQGLVRWATEYIAEKGGSLSLADARFLIDRVGLNQQLLSAELDKLLTYGPKVTKATIETLVEPTPQSTVFDLLEAALAGKTRQAMELYREQRALRVEPQAIIGMLAWQLHILALVKTAGSRNIDAIAKEAKLNPYVVRKTQTLARTRSLEQVKTMVKDLLDLDTNLKTKMIDPDEALQLYLISLASA
jgi:DNA polymerase-3 subunit delta